MVKSKTRFVWNPKKDESRWQLHTTQPKEDIGVVRGVDGVAKVDDFISGSGYMVVYFNPCFDADEVKAEIERLLNES